VLINRPFNAMFNDSLIRLTRPQIQEKDLIHLDEDALRGFENWKSLASNLEQLARKQLEDVPGYEDAPLSQLALATLVWLPGVGSVLCGMRQERYVTDAAHALSRPALLSAKNVLYNIYENLEFHV
jgi:aryl-alcohol dehydrogenase-like predicted oxidoreductase